MNSDSDIILCEHCTLQYVLIPFVNQQHIVLAVSPILVLKGNQPDFVL